MPTLESLLAFVLTTLLMEATPGPNMTYLALLSATHGRKAGLNAVAGIALGLLINGAVAALGAAVLIAEIPAAYQALRFGGAAYLVWIAVQMWRDGEADDESDSPSFRDGLITNLLNPKAAGFYIAVLPQFIASHAPAGPQIALLTVLYVMLATLVHLAIVFTGAQAAQFLQNPTYGMVARRVAAVSLVGVAVWFLWSTRQG